MEKIFLSVVVPVYNEEENILPLYFEVKEVMLGLIKKKKISDYEVIFVNDGSKDRSQEILETLKKKEKMVYLMRRQDLYGENFTIKLLMKKFIII